jgi:predicted nucleic acid-binding protein
VSLSSGKDASVASVFLDTNILKATALKHHVFRPKSEDENIEAGIAPDASIYSAFTENRLNRVRAQRQRRDSVMLGMVAHAGISNMITVYSSREVTIEALGLPGIISASGRFFGCPIRNISDPIGDVSRVVFSSATGADDLTLDFLEGIKSVRFKELNKATGGFQGSKSRLHLNQALDAYHLWCAEHAGMDYFLTMDYKLQRLVAQKTPVLVVTPDQLLQILVPKLGVLGAPMFVWKAYRFAKSRVAFPESDGWN